MPVKARAIIPPIVAMFCTAARNVVIRDRPTEISMLLMQAVITEAGMLSVMI